MPALHRKSQVKAAAAAATNLPGSSRWPGLKAMQEIQAGGPYNGPGEALKAIQDYNAAHSAGAIPGKHTAATSAGGVSAFQATAAHQNASSPDVTTRGTDAAAELHADTPEALQANALTHNNVTPGRGEHCHRAAHTPSLSPYFAGLPKPVLGESREMTPYECAARLPACCRAAVHAHMLCRRCSRQCSAGLLLSPCMMQCGPAIYRRAAPAESSQGAVRAGSSEVTQMTTTMLRMRQPCGPPPHGRTQPTSGMWSARCSTSIQRRCLASAHGPSIWKPSSQLLTCPQAQCGHSGPLV
jgi:hypothetical protein